MSQVKARKGLGAVPLQGQSGQEGNRMVPPLKQQGLDPPTKSSEMLYNTNVDADKPQDISGEVENGDDALLDLDQLEELHDEAERMKALGNKHMAAQVCERQFA